MRRFKLVLIAAASMIAVSSSAFADDNASKDLATGNGWYFSGSAGLAFFENSTNDVGSRHFDTSADNPGFDVNGAIGKELGNGFRLEEELGYHRSDLDHITGYGIQSGSARGDVSALSLMTNGYYDFETGGPLKPFVGAGIGMARVSMNGVAVNNQSLVDDSDLDFAYQAMAGVGYQLTQNGTLYTQYRYFAANDPTFDSGAGQVHSELASHNIEIGYRLMF